MFVTLIQKKQSNLQGNEKNVEKTSLEMHKES